jgi:hypothetical protein
VKLDIGELVRGVVPKARLEGLHLVSPAHYKKASAFPDSPPNSPHRFRRVPVHEA